MTDTTELVELKHGIWIFKGIADNSYTVLKCSHCGKTCTDGNEYLPNYCPHCGARMDATE